MTSRTLGLSPELYDYALRHGLREPPAATELRAVTDTHPDGHIRTAPEQAQFMGLLVELIGARRVLEVGTFTGYAALWMALALPPHGRVVTLEMDEASIALGRPFWEKAGVAERIDVRLGDARDTLTAMVAEGHSESFDLTFIDAKKRHYPDYYELCLKLVRKGGLVLLDNVFWSGRVVDPDDCEPNTEAIRRTNQIVHADARVNIAMLPVGDGLTIARKL